MPDEETQQQYRDALAYWQQQLDRLHAFLLDGERIPPQEIKGLLSREARAKQQYDAARQRLLGIED
jgi:hypothetical protein